MLKMISCDKFKKDAQTINFHMGLNVIRGDQERSNSIGKSTFLMIIDFCFGGRDYPNLEKRTIYSIGHHKINFIFEFDRIDYYFSRSTESPNLVIEYTNNNFNLIKTKYRLDDYNAFLAQKYHLQELGLTLRSVIGKFFRIYNRSTINEVRPLNSSLNDDDQKAIINFLNLYKTNTNIQELINEEENLLKAKSTYDGLKRFNAGHIAKNKEEYKKNEQEIEQITQELNSYRNDNNNGTIDIQAIIIKEKRALKKQYALLKRQEEKLLNNLNDLNIKNASTSFSKNIEKLKEYFPNVNIEKINKVETFHTNVKKLLLSQAKEENNKIEEQLGYIRSEMKRIWAEISQYDVIPVIEQKIIDKNISLSRKLEELTIANKNYDEFSKIKNQLKDLKAKIKNQTNDSTSYISKIVNDKMSELEETYDSQNKFPPQIQITSLNSYKFGIMNDTGTANRYKGVVTFDITVMLQTQLPAIIHDSIFFDSQGDYNIKYIFQLYRLLPNKQIFIAYDNENYLNDKDTNYIKENVILELSKGENTLFGKEFNVKTTNSTI